MRIAHTQGPAEPPTAPPHLPQLAEDSKPGGLVEVVHPRGAAGPDAAPDAVYSVTPVEDGRYRFALTWPEGQKVGPHIITIASDCEDVESSCLASDEQLAQGAGLEVDLLGGVTYTLVVDGDSSAEQGAYELIVELGCVPACEGLECGEDGCGGLCGECESGFDCSEGLCLEPPPVPDGDEPGSDAGSAGDTSPSRVDTGGSSAAPPTSSGGCSGSGRAGGATGIGLCLLLLLSLGLLLRRRRERYNTPSL